jgi:hypothetical protein
VCCSPSSSTSHYSAWWFYIVTLPDGVKAGQVIHVQAPDGRINEIIVPDGFGPGSTFTVEFAKEEEKPTNSAGGYNSLSYVPSGSKTEPSSYSTTPTATTTADPNGDDGFATGFNNPNFVPAATAPTASATATYGDIDFGSYPSASDAKPVYNTTPKY